MQGKDLYKGVISICFPNNAELFKIITDGIYPELVSTPSPTKSNISINMDKHNLCLNVEISTYSLSQLRALINSLFYLIYTSVSTFTVISSAKQTF